LCAAKERRLNCRGFAASVIAPDFAALAAAMIAVHAAGSSVPAVNAASAAILAVVGVADAYPQTAAGTASTGTAEREDHC